MFSLALSFARHLPLQLGLHQLVEAIQSRESLSDIEAVQITQHVPEPPLSGSAA